MTGLFPRTKSSVNQGVGVLQFEFIFCSWDGSFVSFLPLPPAPVTMDFYLGSNFLLLHRDLCTEGRYNKTKTFIKSHLVSSREQSYSRAKGCLSLFSYFIDRRPTLMSPFFVEKTCFSRKKAFFWQKMDSLGWVSCL